MSLKAKWIPIFRVRVIGPSMRPVLENGQVCFALRGSFFARPGAIAVFTHPERPSLYEVKRLIRKVDGAWWVEGDNKEVSTDSRDFGAVETHSILGIVIKR